MKIEQDWVKSWSKLDTLPGVSMRTRSRNALQRAAQVNSTIMRTFVQLRRLMDSNRDLARKIESLEKKDDEQFAAVFEVIRLFRMEAAPMQSQD
jgi:hypothetical protein